MSRRCRLCLRSRRIVREPVQHGAGGTSCPSIPDADDPEGTGLPQQRPSTVDDLGMGDHAVSRCNAPADPAGAAQAAHRLCRARLNCWTIGTMPWVNFKKVMPKDYARALKQLEAEREEAASVAAE